jgi:hypothetical protein
MDVLQNQRVAIAELCHAYSLEKLLAWCSAIVRILEGSSDVDLFIELATIGGHAKLHGIVLGLTRHQTFLLQVS